jgi:hypothetical protein
VTSVPGERHRRVPREPSGAPPAGRHAALDNLGTYRRASRARSWTSR